AAVNRLNAVEQLGGGPGSADDAGFADARPAGGRLDHAVARDLQAGIDAEDALHADVLSHAPAGAALPVFGRDAELFQSFPNLVGHREVLALARFGAEVDEQLNEPLEQLVVGGFGVLRLEQAEDLAQLAHHRGGFAEVFHGAGVRLCAFQLFGVDEAVERGQQLEEDTHGPARVEIVVHAFEERVPQTRDLREKVG